VNRVGCCLSIKFRPSRTTSGSKIWRRLQKIGAVAIKNSVYVLPKSDPALEDFQWTPREITEGGGEGSICEADFVDGLSNDQVEALFKAVRDADYATIAEEARELERTSQPRRRSKAAELPSFEGAIERLRRRLSEVVAIDFFDALGRQTAEGLVSDLEAHLGAPAAQSPGSSHVNAEEFQGRVWVTRKGIHVDRMGSAWLIQRFIDPKAKFKFVPARGYRPQKDEIRFDMFEAEFNHEGDRCTFEVLIKRIGPATSPLRAIAEIIHDIDLKDAKFGHPEVAGIERLITGICTAHKDDDTRLARASAVLDDLHESFARRGR
jgi:hypothetical protein